VSVVPLADLQRGHCRPLDAGARLEGASLMAQLAELPHWTAHEGALRREFTFADFHRTIGFVNAVAWMANAQDHHPDLLVTYSRCTVCWRTHSAGGITLNDCICAARTDMLAAEGP
jgi:4a-hydroxytetrahydrobiopterin dehydratase